MSKYEIENCSIIKVQKVITGKWNMVIILLLSDGVLRFGELQRKLPNITQASLTKQLRILKEYNIVHREVYKVVPPKVEYSLTELGYKFMPVINAIENWVKEYDLYESKLK